MLAPARRKPLPPPRFDAAAMAEYARRGYAWTPLACDGLSARWLTAPGWARAERLPGRGADGFTPLAGLVHPPTQAAAGIRYGRAASDFDVADFLEVADPRPASQSTEYRLGGSLVAERAGATPQGFFATAAHRRGPHLFVVTAEWPLEAAGELAAAMTAFAAGLDVDAPPHAPVETWVRATPAALPIGFDHPERCTVREGDTAVALHAAYPDGSVAEVTLSSVAPGPGAERTLAARVIDLHRRAGRAEQSTVRAMTLESLGHAAGPVAVRTSELADGREATLAVVPLSPAAALVLEATYPGQRRSARAWMAARFTIRRLVASCRPR